MTALISLSIFPALADEGEPSRISLYQYKPIYFLMGNPYTKIEVSFKTQVVSVVPFYFGYTQLMMWDLFISSPRFYDINYDPEVFYRFKIGDSKEQWIDFEMLEHESNGLGGSEERAWNRTSLRFHSLALLDQKIKLYWEIKAWLAWALNSNNAEISRYRGSWELSLTLADFLGPFFEYGDLVFRLYPGGASTINPFLGGQELTFRSKAGPHAFLPLFVFQIFHGYGESLLDLSDDRWGLRAGIGF